MLAYVKAVETEHTITIDGYTTNKTEKGIISDVARVVKKYSERDSNYLLDSILFKESPFVKAESSCGNYFFEYEEVPSAAYYNEKTDEIEYKEGYRYYFCIRIVK